MSKPYNRKDHLYSKAKEEGYRSRAAYKLIELDKKARIFRKAQTVLDLGSYPGGWLQVAAERVGNKGRVVGVDLRPLEAFSKHEQGGNSDALLDIPVILGDVCERDTIEALLEACGGRADVMISDMSPKLSGIKFRDIARSAALVETALHLCPDLLKKGGALVAKVFPGSDTDALVPAFKEQFSRFQRVHLKSTRSSSSEYYFVAKGYQT